MVVLVSNGLALNRLALRGISHTHTNKLNSDFSL